jgi:uncharacterized protein HemX
MAAAIYLLILVAAFIGIVIWVFGRKRKARFEAEAGFLSTIKRVISHDDGRLICRRSEEGRRPGAIR